MKIKNIWRLLPMKVKEIGSQSIYDTRVKEWDINIETTSEWEWSSKKNLKELKVYAYKSYVFSR